MKKRAKLLCLCGAAGAALPGALLFLIAPGRRTAAQAAPFLGRNFAHRGLFDAGRGIPENSLAAFRAAAEGGYGVELDVRLTKDGYVVVSHDNDLFRMTGVKARVDELTLAALRKLRLGGTEERVPLFSEALDVLCAARVPVIVEVKTVKARSELCRKTLAVMDEHGGELCVESFDPLTGRWFRRHAPDVFRGQLTSQAHDLGPTRLAGFALSRVLSNCLARPQFIAHRVGKKSLCVRLCEKMGAVRVCWTAHDRSHEPHYDAVIFERFRPPARFR